MSAPDATGSRPRAVVTGASRGLGRVLSGFLAARGFDLVVNARDPGALTAAVEALRGSGGSVVAVAGDIGAPTTRAEIVRAAAPDGRLDLLVNNASELGASPLVPLTELSSEALERVLEVNLVAPLALVRELAGALEAAGGLVVNLSSDAALGAYPGWGGYGASKAALDLASRTLARELAGRRISVVSVDPGDMRTALHEAAAPDAGLAELPEPDVTLPFFAWLLGQEPQGVTGRRFLAQAERWEVA